MRSRSKYLVITTDYLIPFLIIVLPLLGYLLAYHTSIFAIKNISCTLDYEPCQIQNLVAELDRSLGDNLVALNPDSIKSRLLSGEYTIRSVEVSRQLPSTLQVDLLSTYPVIALQLTDNPGQWIAIDSQMRVINVLDHDPNVPALTLNSTPPFLLGERVSDSDVIKALEIALEISSDLSSVEKIHLNQDSTLTLSLNNGITALMTTSRDQSDQIRTLQSILIDKDIIKDHKVVDVRFTSPVLKSY